MQFGYLAQRLFNQPLALLPRHAELLGHMLRSGKDDVAMLGPTRERDRDAAGYFVVQGVAVVSVQGILLNGSGYSWCGLAYYADIRAAIAGALSSPDVKAIALLIDSPGGLVTGCFDLADFIFLNRGSKPIWAILDEMAFSAAYALASACDRITVPRTGGTGSIGVLSLHVDISGALDQAGIKITPIQFGARKTDGYPTAPLSEPALARIQADVDAIGAMFVSTVARNRGIGPDVVKATEAGTFLGQDGVKVKLADAVMSPDEAFLSLVNTLG